MKNKLKEMLLQHKPITEQTFDIEATDGEFFKKERLSDGHTPESIAILHNVSTQYILDQIEEGIKVEREHTSDEAEARLIAMDHLVELPDYYTRLDKMEEEGKKDLEEDVEDVPAEDAEVEEDVEDVEDVPEEEVEDAEIEEDVEDVPEEENSHTIADAIEESFLIPKSLKIKYHNSRMKANTKKLNKNLDELEKAKKWLGNHPDDADTINKMNELKDKVDKNAAKIDSHTDKYKEVHDAKHKKLADKILYEPGRLEQIIRDPRRLRKIHNPSMFAAQVENLAKSDNETSGSFVNTASKRREDVAKHTKELKQAGKPRNKEKPKDAPKVAPSTVLTPHQKVASNVEAVKERLSKVRSIM